MELKKQKRLKDFKTKHFYQIGNVGEIINYGVGIDIYTLLCMEWMSNKDLLYSTGKST